MRKAGINDLEKIIKIIDDAKISLKKDGVDQWQIGSMDKTFIRGQINDGRSYVYEKDGEIVTYAYLSDREEPSYSPWENYFKGERYITIHTFAVGKNFKNQGYGMRFFIDIIKFAERNQLDSLRIDTHEDNKKMRGLINKLAFKKIGQIYIDEEGIKKPRLCYELLL